MEPGAAPYPPSDEKGVPVALSPTPSLASLWAFPLVTLFCPRMGCSIRAAKGTPTPRGGLSRFFRSALLTPQLRKKFLAVMTVYNQDTSSGWYPSTLSGTPISVSCYLWEQIQTPSVWTVHIALGAPCPTLGGQAGRCQEVVSQSASLGFPEGLGPRLKEGRGYYHKAKRGKRK